MGYPPARKLPIGIPGAIGDGVVDDTAAVQAYLNSGVPFIDLGPYTYAITSVAAPASLRHMWGWGVVSNFSAHPSKTSRTPLISVTGANNIIIERFSLGNGAQGLGATTTIGLLIANSAGPQVSDCVVVGPGISHNILMDSCNQGIVRNCRSLNSRGAFGVCLSNSTDCWIRDCFTTPELYEGVQMTDCQRGGMVGNTVICQPGHTDFGISMEGANAQGPTLCVGGLTANNTIVNSGRCGIGVAHGTNSWRITGNYIQSPGQHGEANFGYGIILYGSSLNQNNAVYGNTFVDYSGFMRYAVAEVVDGQGHGDPSSNNFGPNYGVPGSAGWYSALGPSTMTS